MIRVTNLAKPIKAKQLESNIKLYILNEHLNIILIFIHQQQTCICGKNISSQNDGELSQPNYPSNSRASRCQPSKQVNHFWSLCIESLYNYL